MADGTGVTVRAPFKIVVLPNSGKSSARSKASGPVSRRKKIESRRAKRKKNSWPIFLFLLGLVWPCVILVGPLRLSLYRIVLLLLILPCLGIFFTGNAGRIRIADVALLLFSFWCVLSLIVVNGVELSVQTSGIVFLETAGSYLLARCFIRDADDFYNMIQLLFRLVLLLLPFAIFESVSGQNISRELFALICPTFTGVVAPQRWGLTRVESVFDHPILFGVVTGSIFALVHLVLGYKQSLVRRALMTGAVGATAVLSLSAGPLIALILQGLLLSWNSLLQGIKSRWKILIGLLAAMVLLIEMVANRSVPAIVASYLTFDDLSYWFRLLIWDYGSAAALNHPLFGAGLDDWERPEWMPRSIDNLWLFFAVRNGLPAPLLLLVTLLSIFLAVGFKKGLDDKITAYRTAFLITMTAFFLVSWTVTFWDAAYVIFLFLMGSGVWILDVETKERAALRLPSQPARYGAT
jgi:O-antigen ligase